MPQKLLARMQLVQNTAARLICRVKKRDHISPSLQSLHWLPVVFRPRFKILCLVFRALNGVAPRYISELINRYHPKRSLRSENKNLLCVPSSRTVTYGHRLLTAAAATLWNELPQEIREAQDLTTFKGLLKTYYFRCAYASENL